ncbi:MAG: hypothetical protein EB156_05185 [Euryarchaeota archaeon]|nr:hypothetical protein [Euryarchaeota archaeon]NDG22000.1 hypothetical protein [Euryarchaeota archaeon]
MSKDCRVFFCAQRREFFMDPVYRRRLPEGVKHIEIFKTKDGKWQLNVEGKPILKTDDVNIIDRISEMYYARSA